MTFGVRCDSEMAGLLRATGSDNAMGPIICKEVEQGLMNV